jgi:excinuclease ABC subunit A
MRLPHRCRPEGGHGCGNIVTKGTPEQVAKHKTSHTARFLKRELGGVCF